VTGPWRVWIIATAAAAFSLAAWWDAADAQQSLACRGAEQPRETAELVFGHRIGSRGVVGTTAWRQFVAREITPRFPNGFTIIPAKGQSWDPANRQIIHEVASVVLIALPGNPDDHDRLDQISDAYKRLFRQRSVGIIIRPACVSF
jgi:hypothetical protein